MKLIDVHRYIQLHKLISLIGKVTAFRATLAMNIADLESTWRAADAVGVTVNTLRLSIALQSILRGTPYLQEDLGSHMIDLIVWLFGNPSSVTAHQVNKVRRFQTYGGDDVSNIIMQWNGPNHFIGHVHLSRVAHKSEESIVVTGTMGTLLLEDKKVTMLNTDGSEALSMVDKATKKAVTRSMLRQFGDYATGVTTDYPCSLDNLEEALGTIDNINRSFKSNTPVSAQQERTAEVSSLSGNHFGKFPTNHAVYFDAEERLPHSLATDHSGRSESRYKSDA